MNRTDITGRVPSADAVDTQYMRMAIAEARQAAAEGEIPVGAVIVANGRILAQAHNMTQALDDVTAHAEVLAITAAAQAMGGKYLTDCTLYVTLEPCLMCAGALGWSQISRVVVGAADDKRGFSTFVSKSPFHPKTVYCQGVMADECAALMRDFFRRRR